MRELFGRTPRSRMALETGMHSPWVSRWLSELGQEVMVAHARNVRLIGKNRRSDDRNVRITFQDHLAPTAILRRWGPKVTNSASRITILAGGAHEFDQFCDDRFWEFRMSQTLA